jgi:4-amino-4-deoxy-L-arabinose transferase-like glycosyltransferase
MPSVGSLPSGARAGGGSAVSSTAAAALAKDASRYTWIAATSSAQTAAGIELATGKSVMAIGGFTGSDNAITLARFEQLVSQGKIHYYIAGGGGPGGGGSSTATGGSSSSGFSRAGGPGMGSGVTQTIESWVAKHFKSKTVGGMTVYDLTRRTA